MNVLLVTLLVSLCLTAIFVAAFLFTHLKRRDSGPERESLLPLEDASPSAPRPISTEFTSKS